MKTYNQIKSTHQTNYNKILEQNQVFWAFSDEQLQKGIKKYNINKDNKMVSIGMGGYMPLKYNKRIQEQMKEEDKRYKKELKEMREEQDGAILYELNNHECFYTGDIEDVVTLFKGIFTPAKIKKVFLKHQKENVL